MNENNPGAAKVKKKRTRKQEQQMRAWIRIGVQILFFIFLPSAYAAAFNGAKYVMTQIGAGQPLEWTPFVQVLVGLIAYTIVFGRFFCGWGCAFGALDDWIHAIYSWYCKRKGKKPKRLSDKAYRILPMGKYIVLTVILLLCFAGVYGDLPKWSPWEVFSMLHAGNFKFAGYGLAIVIFILVLICMALEERFFCRFLCPMGAIFSLLPMLPFFSLHRHKDECLPHCGACTKNCPCYAELPNVGDLDVMGECIMCHRCSKVCPKGNIHTGIWNLDGYEFPFLLVRIAILAGLLVGLGV